MSSKTNATELLKAGIATAGQAAQILRHGAMEALAADIAKKLWDAASQLEATVEPLKELSPKGRRIMN
jgi:hypothetical protein